MAALLTKMRECRSRSVPRSNNPLVLAIARVLPADLDEITSATLADLMGVRASAIGTRAKLARAMLELGWLPFRQRRSSGHWRGQELRGFTRIVRSPRTGARS